MFPLALLVSTAHAEEIQVSSNIADAAILVNGVDTGLRTPARVQAPWGRAQVTVERGCERGEALVDVPRGGVGKVSVFAQAQSGWLRVELRPEAASLELDGNTFPGVVGVPVEVTCGQHSLRATREGYLPSIVTVDVGPGREETASINMVAIAAGALDLSVTPREATIYLDGTPIGTGDLSIPTVYEGMHVVSARLDGWQSAEKSVMVRGSDALAYKIVLEKTGAKNKQSRVTLVERGPVGAERDADAPKPGAEGGLPPSATPPPDRRTRDRAPQASAPTKPAPVEVRDSGTKTDGAWTGREWGGVAALAGAAGGAAFTVWSWQSVNRAYVVYQDRMDAAGNDPALLETADRFYTLNVRPRATRLYAAGAGTVALAAAGTALTLLDAELRIAPVGAHGAWLGWERHF